MSSFQKTGQPIRRGALALGVLLVCITTLSAPFVAAQTTIRHMVRAPGAASLVTREEQMKACTDVGATLAMTELESTHANVVEALSISGAGSHYFSYLGGSTTKSQQSGACDNTSPSLGCVWYWEEGVYADNNLLFYTGNLYPYVAMANEDGLVSAKYSDTQPRRWGKSGVSWVHPGWKFGSYAMLVSYDAVTNAMADNAEIGGFPYATTVSGTDSSRFYAVCRLEEATTTSQPTFNPGIPTTAKPGFMPSTTSPDATLPPTTEPFQDDLKSNTASQVGSAILVAVVIVLVFAFFIVCCCCSERIGRCLCPEKDLIGSDDESDVELDDASSGNSRSRASSSSHGSQRARRTLLSAPEPSQSDNTVSDSVFVQP